jgi:hypothetical protein
LQEADTRLITASLDERLESHNRALSPLDRKADWLHQPGIEGERRKVMNTIESIQREHAAFPWKAASDVGGAAAARGVCAQEGERRLQAAVRN